MGKGKMVLKSKGRIWLPKKTMRGGAHIYVPARIVLDSTFPFTEDGEVEIEIDSKTQTLSVRPSQAKKRGKT